METVWGRIVYLVVRTVCVLGTRIAIRLLGGWRVEGLENVPRKGGVLVAPNHLSHLDPPLVGALTRRHAWFVATDELFEIRVLGRLSTILRVLPIHQDSPDRSALRRLRGLLEAGECVVLFPEGHESLDGRLRPLQGGVILLALWSRVPIVPVGIVGTDAMMAPREFRPRRTGRPAVVRYGEPISAADLSGGLTGRDALDHGLALLEERMRALVGQTETREPQTCCDDEGIREGGTED